MENNIPAAAVSSRALAAMTSLALLGACTTVAATPLTFEDTNWQVTAIDGQSTPVSDAYRVQFDDGRIGGRFGCNSFGGNYAVTGDTMTAVDVISTLMGCPEPAATFEQQGLAVLQQPMRIDWQSDQQLVLSNGAGSIALQRL